MASKLFRTVVSVGISLTTASVGCFGAIDSGGEAGEPAGEPARESPRESPREPATEAHPAPGSPTHSPRDATAPDARLADATSEPIDAPRDVRRDAFCDVSWPTTKGNTARPTCSDLVECADAGRPYDCARVLAPFVCDDDDVVATRCQAGGWECPTGTAARWTAACPPAAVGDP